MVNVSTQRSCVVGTAVVVVVVDVVVVVVEVVS
jgi:hypothetical protein